MTDRRQTSRTAAERRFPATPAAGTPVPGSGEFRRGETRGAVTRATPAAASITRPDLPRYNPASPSYGRPLPPPAAPPAKAGPRRFPTIEMAPVRTTEPEPPPSGRMLDDSLSFELDLDADGGLELDCLPSTHFPRVEQPRQSSFDPPPSAARPSPPVDRAPPSRPGAQPPPSRSRPDLGLPLPPPPSRPNGANANGPPSAPGRTTNRGMPAVGAPPPSTPRGAGTTQAMERLDQHAAIVAFSGFGDPPSRILAMPGYAMRVMRRKRILKEELARAKSRSSHDVGLYEAALRAADDGAVRSGVIVMIMALVLALLLGATVLQVCGVALPFMH